MSRNYTREQADRVVDLAVKALAEVGIDAEGLLWPKERPDGWGVAGSWAIPPEVGKKALALGAMAVSGPDTPCWCIGHGIDDGEYCTTVAALARGDLYCAAALTPTHEDQA